MKDTKHVREGKREHSTAKNDVAMEEAEKANS